MDLSTRYLGFDLPHPYAVGACPLTNDLDLIRQLEDAGTSMITMTSLFEEELKMESLTASDALDSPKEQFAEALSYLPEPEQWTVGPEEYLDKVRRTKQAVQVPVVASLNGTSLGGWLEMAEQIQQAGADALELNLYSVATDFERSSESIESESVAMVKQLKQNLQIPLTVKLSPFYTSLPNFVKQLDEAGVDGLVLFNRFYQPDIDVEELELERSLHLSTARELLMRLRWTAILFEKVNASLAITGGIHTAVDGVKATMSGANLCQIVSALLINGPQYMATIIQETKDWLEQHEYESLSQARGSMSAKRSPQDGVYERANYLHILRSWENSLNRGG